MVEATLPERCYRSRGFTSPVDALHAAANPPPSTIVDLMMPALVEELERLLPPEASSPGAA